MPTLLVTGASGFLGWHLCQAAQSDWRVVGTYHTQAIALAGVELRRCDLTDALQLGQLFAQVQPDAVIHTAALSQPNACQQQPEVSYRVNVLATWAIAERCATLQIPLIFTSSEQVFDGTAAPYDEAALPRPLNLYGEHKLAAEQGLWQRHPRAVVCRMPLMFGCAPQAESFLQPFITRLQGGTLQAFTDEIRTPVSAHDAAQGLLLALRQPHPLLHLGGGDRLSRYAIAQILLETLGISATFEGRPRIQACLQAEVPMQAPRAQDLSLDSRRAMALGYAPQDFRSALAALFAPVKPSGDAPSSG
jgi:dTDP-4-dehydrorhamnose reductase